MSDSHVKSNMKIEQNLQEDFSSQTNQPKQIIGFPTLHNNSQMRGESSKSKLVASHNSTSQMFKMNSIKKDIDSKIDNFQRSLLHVSNKQIFPSDKLHSSDSKVNLGNDSSTNGHGNSDCTSHSLPKRKVFKYKNGMIIDKITENQNTPNTKNNFQSVYNSEYLDRVATNLGFTHNCASPSDISGLNSPQQKRNKVEVLPSIQQSAYVGQQYYISSKKNPLKKKKCSEHLSSLSANHNSNSSDIFYSLHPKDNTFDHMETIRDGQKSNYDKKEQKSRQYSLQNKNHLYEMQLGIKDSVNEEESEEQAKQKLQILEEQKEKIFQGVEKLKQLRERRFTQHKLKKIDKLKQRISVLQELEKQIPLIENMKGEIDLQKQKEIEDKLNINGDKQSSVASTISEDECLSRNSSEFIFKKLDEITVTEAAEETNGERIQDQMKYLDEIVTQKTFYNSQSPPPKQSQTEQKNNDQYLLSKSTNKSSVLDSILEEHQDYFNHIAGKCACGQCHCGRCQVKCQVSQKKPQVFNMTWESSYNRSYNHNLQNNAYKDQHDIKIMRQESYQLQQQQPQDYMSTFKKDYQYPSEISYNKIVKYDRIKEGPLYSLSTYKSNYVDWKSGVPENHKLSTQKTVVPGIPLMGSSTMKKDFQVLDQIKTDMIKPPDQAPLPRFSINRYQYSKQNDFSPIINHKKLSRSDILKLKPNDYIPVPSFEGQYKTSTQKQYSYDQASCEGMQKLYDMYQRKINKYQQKLEKQIQNLEQAK